MSSSVSGYYHVRQHGGGGGASPPPGSLGSRNSALSVDEAYRRLGYRLSRSVGGHHHMTAGGSSGGHEVTSNLMLQQPTIRFSSKSAFRPPASMRSAVPPIQLFPLPGQQRTAASDDASMGGASLQTATSRPESLYDREAKIAKLRQDAPPAAKKRSTNMLRQLTMFAKDNFASWEEDGRSPRYLSKSNRRSSSSKQKQQQQPQQRTEEKPKGFLHMALEGGSLSSNNSKVPSTKCLTTPSEPVSNNRKDNAEGNLIVYEGDVMLPSQVQSVWNSSYSKQNGGVHNHGWKVLGLLGQGTFAQVFECQHLETNERVAIKVVKNKTAYTRQAAVEIDVFQALHQTAATTTSGDGGKGTNANNDRDTMVHLECYFMYQQHLCLVFELLGLNLYEVLKKRQFRGLSLRVVTSLLRQAMDGIKILSQKQIVHCDLKPENILLVSDDDGSSETENKPAGNKDVRKRRGVDLSFESLATAEKINSKPNMNPKQSTTTSFATTTTTGSTSSSSSSGDGSRPKSNNTGRSKAPSSTNPAASTGTPMTHDSSLICQSFDGSDPKSEHSSKSSRTVKQSTPPSNEKPEGPRIKLIDFGSACFEGHTAHTYIQSRFYRSPEVLIGLPYDSSIDMWSLGCVAAELFLGLPILPGVHEHDQLGRICEMIGTVPDWMLDQGSKASKYFIKEFSRSESGGVSSNGSVGAAVSAGASIKGATVTPPSRTPSPSSVSASTAPPRPSWRIKTQPEYIHSLSASEIRKKGGLAKLEKQNTNRYFKRKKLSDIIKLHGHQKEDREQLGLFIHFLLGILEPDPWKRWTAFQASQHPFITGSTLHRRRQQQQDTSSGDGDGSLSGNTTTDKSSSSSSFDIYWVPPWDPSICRRKLLNVQKTREKQQALRRSYGAGASSSSVSSARPAPTHPGAVILDPSTPDKVMSRKMMDEPPSPAVSQASTGTSRVTAMTDAMSLSRQSGTVGAFSQSTATGASSPLPPTFLVSSGAASSAGTSSIAHQSAPHTLAGSLGSGIVGSSIPPASAGTAYMASSSLTDYHQQAAAAAAAAAHHPSLAMASPHMHGLSYGDVAAAAQHGAMMMAPQSYQGSVGSYSGLQQVPLDADLGYALQRPGVVPGAGDLSSSYTLNQGTAAAPPSSGPMAFSPHHHLPSHGRASSYSSGTARSSRYRRHQQFSQPQHGSFRGTATASIQEDVTDSKSSSVASGTSLLAQQLEESALASQGSRSQHMVDAAALQMQQQQMYYMQRIQGHHHPAEGQQPMAPMDAAMLQQHSMPHNYMPAQQATSYGYYTYVAANGTPLQQQSAVDMRSGVDMRGVPPAGFSSYGSYNNDPMNQQHAYVSPASLHSQPTQQTAARGYAGPPSYLGQPSLDTHVVDGQRQAHHHSMQQHYTQGGLNPHYRGMSM